MLNDDETVKYFKFTLATDAEAFVGVHFYGDRMYPYGCHGNGKTNGYLSILTESGTILNADQYIFDEEEDTEFNYIDYPTLSAGTYVAIVKMNQWGANVVPDYTFRVVTPQTTTISLMSSSDIVTFNNSIAATILSNGINSVSNVGTSNLNNMTTYSGLTGGALYSAGYYLTVNSTYYKCKTQYVNMTFTSVYSPIQSTNATCSSTAGSNT